jgi:S-adenosylmethionine:tRNA ribosyltransferase-isomerase
MLDLKNYDYVLSKDRIAQYPAAQRDHSKLMIVKKASIDHRIFHQIIEEVEAGDLFVVNNSKVIASSLEGQKESGGRIDCVFLRAVNPEGTIWECILKGRRVKKDSKIQFLDGKLKGHVLNWIKFGQFLIEFQSEVPVKNLLREYASITLPLYIRALQQDFSRYQTTYASIEGSIAAPTAGFHFSPELIQKIEKKGAKFVAITLHVGYSTFMHVTDEMLTTRKTGEIEYFSIAPASIEAIEKCKTENRHLIAVGTTTVKTLEAATSNSGRITQSDGWSDLFIAPGHSFKSGVTRMLTNFHMPQSPPLLMICAFAGRERIFQAYQEAIAQNYRFYSFGDAMLVDRQ